MRIFMSWLMVLMHIIADFSLQGILASMKQRQWWEDNYPDEKYKIDWKASLWMHSVEWSIMIILPYFVYMLFFSGISDGGKDFIAPIFSGMTLINAWIHAIIDNAKCNELKINLIIDQSLHLLQLFVTDTICYHLISTIS